MSEPQSWRDRRVEMDYSAYFRKASLAALARSRDTYEFVDHYEVLRKVIGYELHYANYGYWRDGVNTVEPAREMTMHLGQAMGIQSGQKVLEAGSGLGQAAVDMVLGFGASKVEGLNISKPQLAFANDLARGYGLQDQVLHRDAEACAAVEGYAPGSFDHALAQECIGHFPDPARFMRGLHRLLPPGGRFAFTLVVSPQPPSSMFAGLTRLVFHTVPKDGGWWASTLEQAGFKVVVREDLRQEVFGTLFKRARARMQDHPELMLEFPAAIRGFLFRFLDASEGALDRGYLGYEMLVGERS